MTDTGLNPAQQRTLSAIRLEAEERITFDANLAEQLQDQINEALAQTADLLAKHGSDQWVSKSSLASVNGCEASYLASQKTPFEYNLATARGTVVHRGVEFWANPVDAKDEAPDFIGHAINHYIDQDTQSGNKLGRFLAELSTGDESALASECISLLQSFVDTFPAVQRSWKLGVEVPRRHLLCEGKIVLNGKYDLTLGEPGKIITTGSAATEETAASGETESQAETAAPKEIVTPGRVIIDLKTGWRNPTDSEDMRFYALIETLVTGVPPMLVGTFYIAEGRAVTEKVDMAVLETALRRTVDGAKRLVELGLGDVEPIRRAGSRCLWCSISDDCEPGQAWLAERES